jgi:hypothetical protein
MEHLIWIISILNLALTIGCFGIQAKGIKKGIYDSSLASWVIWSCIFFFMFIIHLTEKGWTSMAYLMAIQAVAHMIMLGITYQYSEKMIGQHEKKLLWISGLGGVVWVASIYISHLYNINIIIPTIIGIAVQIIADASASLPYIAFIMNSPERQPIRAWVLNVCIYPLTMLSIWINHESPSGYVFLIYGLVLYGGMMVVLAFKQRTTL